MPVSRVNKWTWICSKCTKNDRPGRVNALEVKQNRDALVKLSLQTERVQRQNRCAHVLLEAGVGGECDGSLQRCHRLLCRARFRQQRAQRVQELQVLSPARVLDEPLSAAGEHRRCQVVPVQELKVLLPGRRQALYFLKKKRYGNLQARLWSPTSRDLYE